MKSILCVCLILLSFAAVTTAQTQPGLKAGTKAPDFVALNYEGNPVQLSSLYKQGPVVLLFYRGGWCYYCNIQLRQFQAKLDEFKKYNASLIAVSVDKPLKAAETVKSLSLGFDVISDRQTSILKSYNLIYQVPAELNEKYKNQYNIDLEAASGRADHVISIPATYIIGQTGTIVFAYANEDYKVRTSPEEILRELKKLDKPRAEIRFTPIKHASLIIQAAQTCIYVDPVGEPAVYKEYAKPDIILITDIHHDHFDPKAIAYLGQEDTVIVGPKAIIEQIRGGEILNNGESARFKNVEIEAIPMYNLTTNRLKFHEKGRGNGYVVTLSGKRIYISGDTEDIPEMRKLKAIDYAFVCMNLPYTMTVEQAASAAAEFKPKVVFPYHYRGKSGMSDIEKFKELLSEEPNINVRFLKWY